MINCSSSIVCNSIGALNYTLYVVWWWAKDRGRGLNGYIKSKQQRLTDGATSAFYWKQRRKQMWRHLSIAVAALKTVVQRVRSNRWRFNFERARTGGQINFLWKMAMIITITKASILIIWPFPRGLLLTYPLSPPLIGVQLLLGQTVYGSLWK